MMPPDLLYPGANKRSIYIIHNAYLIIAQVLSSLANEGPFFGLLEDLSDFPLVRSEEGNVLKELISRLWTEEEPLSAHLDWLKNQQEALGRGT